MGKNVYQRVKRSFLWPTALATVEHSLAHNTSTGALNVWRIISFTVLADQYKA